MMMNSSFFLTIKDLISAYHTDKWEVDNSSSICPIIIIPQKKLAFHIISVSQYPYLNSQYYTVNLTNAFFNKGIRLIQLWEDLWVHKPMVMESRVKLLLGNFTRIHGRKTLPQRIDKHTADDFLNKNHLYPSPTSKYRYALYLNGTIVAAATFSAMRTYWRDKGAFRSTELIRFASLMGYSVAGGLGKLISTFIREHSPDDIMSYADRDWSWGKSYGKLGFKKIEYTPPQKFCIHPVELIRYNPHRLTVSKSKDILMQHSNEECIHPQSFMSIYNSGNIKYLLMLR